MSIGGESPDPELARIELLLKAARLEVVGLAATDHELRRAICRDLDDMLKTLRASVQSVLIKHGLDPFEKATERESNSPQLPSHLTQAHPPQGGRRPV